MTKRKYDEEQNSLPPETESVMASFKDPLTPVPGGHGYLGTVAYDKEKKYVQCHMCGRFYQRLGNHVEATHGVAAKEYRERMGLPKTLSLTPPNAKNPNYERWAKMSPEEKRQTLERLKNSGRNTRHSTKRSLHQRNLEGRCPEQLLSKILIVKEQIGKTPTIPEFVAVFGYGHYASVVTTFGGWTKALETLNLQPRSGRYQKGANAYDKKLLIKLLQDFKKQYGREPMSSDMGRGLLPSRQAYQTHFGSISQAKEYIR